MSNYFDMFTISPTWCFIPLSKWVTTLVVNGISGVSPLITGVITHLLSGMNHQVVSLVAGPFKAKWLSENGGHYLAGLVAKFPHMLRLISQYPG